MQRCSPGLVCTHARPLTRAPTYMRAHLHAYPLTRAPTYTRIHLHARLLTRAPTYTRTHLHARPLTRAQCKITLTSVRLREPKLRKANQSRSVPNWKSSPYRGTRKYRPSLRIVLAELPVEYGKRTYPALQTAPVSRGAVRAPLSRLVQLLLHHGERDLVSLQEAAHRDHLARAPPAAVAVVRRVGVVRRAATVAGTGRLAPHVARRDSVTALLNMLRPALPALTVQFADHPVEQLLDDNRCDVEEAARGR